MRTVNSTMMKVKVVAEQLKQGFEVQDIRLKKRPKPSKNGAINTLSGVVLAYDFQDNWSFIVGWWIGQG